MVLFLDFKILALEFLDSLVNIWSFKWDKYAVVDIHQKYYNVTIKNTFVNETVPEP